ncbi:response regulator transcription factor [Methylophaga sulfidovorans]|uniref:DNA-binding response regulator, OmpR family, contains REC and winged-helix (WHTH) domain n=1 Tax=Methylophaga sulfidovorans TaxID=45496 RepID=A0A1I3UTX2_9GAMM|nr:response regulator transcription factor [Methylophaga sulfidovorans]SFJ86435.1 DNA-binding response regulator, OmpR family, contains REC and winged-helix (wHTH) domain [Methylophaga sulfidovorans]
MFHVLLIEDDLDLAETVIDYLSLENIECDHASNGVMGLQLSQENEYDVLLLDLNLPRMDGLTVCEKLRKQGYDIPILMLTARDQISDKITGFNTGTDDYLVKPFDLDELVVRIRALARRRSGQVQRLQCDDLIMDLQTKTVSRQGQLLKLSPTSWQLLEVLMRAYPEVVTKQKLETAIWGDMPPDSDSLKVHMFHLRKAVDAPFDKSLIHTIPSHGFALRNET